MDTTSQTFETLALELSPAERADFLERLRTICTVSDEVLYKRVPEQETPLDYNAAYKRFNFFMRLFISIQAFFGRISKNDLIKQHILQGVYADIDARTPGLIDAKRAVLRESFYKELVLLRNAARYFYDLLDRTLEKNRAAFFAFLVSIEFEAIHNELYTEADPKAIGEQNTAAADADIKAALNAVLESAFSRMDDDARRVMTQEVKSLHLLKKLSIFLFERFLGSFQSNEAGFKEVSLYAASEFIDELASILVSLDTAPSERLMEAILAFSISEDLNNNKTLVDEAVRKELVNAESALSAIREFNAKVPIEAIAKAAHGDPSWQCVQIGGGEDWFALFKSYWKNKADALFQRYMSERRIARLASDIESLVGGETHSSLGYIQSTNNDSIPPVALAHALLFLEDFYNQTFLKDINKYLKIILLEGEFYKRDNRLEFTEAYNGILQIGEALIRFDRRLSPEAELGLAYAQARNEFAAIQVKKKKIDAAIKAVHIEAEAIVGKTYEAVKKMSEILHAVTSGETRGRYDSLSNLGQIEGKNNKEFQRNLEITAIKLEKVCYIIQELSKAGGAV